MRSKDEILSAAINNISDDKYGDKRPLWLEYRKLEVMIGIRDTLKGILDYFNSGPDDSEGSF